MSNDACSLIAFYLPQFHPIPENDLWWGEGFTEWAHVLRSLPRFREHVQPRFPTDLGFYDLRDPAVMAKQIDLAKQHGIHGFCFHYYWFNGKRLLERPIEMLLENRELDMPFCINYANENWTRRWDGLDDEVLIAQHHSEEDDLLFLESLLPYFNDPRYIKIDGKPMVLVYRTSLFPDAAATADRWRNVASKNGLELFLCKVETSGDTKDPAAIGFDAAVELPPHGLYTQPSILPGVDAKVLDYSFCAQMKMDLALPEYTFFRGIMPSWDNTPRRLSQATVFHGTTPYAYQRWLSFLIDQTCKIHPPGRRFVFINAWNEWGEGAVLEPCSVFGRGMLSATKAAINIQSTPSPEDYIERAYCGNDRYTPHVPGSAGILPAQKPAGSPRSRNEDALLQLPAVLICGMHRSGTSLTARLLQASGVHIGDQLLRPDQANPRGYFENEEFYQFHSTNLREAGLHPDGWCRAPVSEFTEELMLRARQLAIRNARRPVWGWKEPRTILFLDLWLDTLPQAKLIFVYRAPWEVADSLYRRGDAYFVEHPEEALRVWETYNRIILDCIKRYPERSMLIGVDGIMREPNEFISRAAQHLAVRLETVPESLAEPDLISSGSSLRERKEVVRALWPSIYDLWCQLRSIEGVATDEDVDPPNLAASILKDWGASAHCYIKARRDPSQETHGREGITPSPATPERLSTVASCRGGWYPPVPSARSSPSLIEKTGSTSRQHARTRLESKGRAISAPSQRKEASPRAQLLLEPVRATQRRPFWTVIIPVHNRTRYLKRCLGSILDQDPGIDEMEIIVTDDCSDNALDIEQIVQESGRDRARYYSTHTRLGVYGNTNDALRRSSGIWIHVLHDDDYVVPTFYATMRNSIEQLPETIGIACCHYSNVDEGRGTTWSPSRLSSAAGVLHNWLETVSIENPLNIPAVVIRRAVFEQIGVFAEDLAYTGDWEFYVRSAMHYQWWYLPEDLARYSIHPGQLTWELEFAGKTASDIRRTIERIACYLPPDMRQRLIGKASRLHSKRFLTLARSAYNAGDRELALTFMRECAALSEESTYSPEFQELSSLLGDLCLQELV